MRKRRRIKQRGTEGAGEREEWERGLQLV